MKKLCATGFILLASLGINSPASATPASRWVPEACANPEKTVSPEATRQATTATVGLISDRIASSVAGYNSGTTSSAVPSSGPTTNNIIAPVQTTPCGHWGGPIVTLDLNQADTPAPVQASAKDNGFWLAGSSSWVQKSDHNAKLHGQVLNSVAGYDRKLDANTVVGLAMGYEHYDFDTAYNNGTVTGQNLTFAPYIGYAINSWLSVDATAGHGWVTYDYGRNSGLIIGNTDASRWFGSADLNATHREGDFVFRGSVGYLKLYEKQDRYRESDGTDNASAQVNLGEARATIGGAYEIREEWGVLSPTAYARYEYDLNAPHSVVVATNGISSTNRMGVTFGLGAEAQIKGGWKFGLMTSTEEFRRNTNIYTLLGTARYSF